MSIRPFIHRCVLIYDKIIDFIVRCTQDMLLLIIRVYVASIFFQSGWHKVQYALEGNWYKTVFLFKQVHPIPYLPAEISAIIGTGAEVGFSLMLALGIMGRIGALGLLGVTAVITFAVHSHFTHAFWALLLAVSFVMGPGKLSFDAWLRSYLESQFVAKK